MLIEILSAFLLVTAIGFSASVLLSLVSHFFEVKKNETEQKIREMLPGANCGACGYKGCNDYARALSEKTASVNLCLPGGSRLAEELAEALGADAEEVEKKAALVKCGADCNSLKTDYIYDGIKTCKAASALFGGRFACKFGCLGFGDCAEVCPTGSVCIKDGIAHIDASRCHGCGKCAAACPRSIIEIFPIKTKTAVICSNTDKGAEARKACTSSCIGCKKCEKTCEAGAITVQNNLARVDGNLCNGCGKCVEACPTGCLKAVFSGLNI